MAVGRARVLEAIARAAAELTDAVGAAIVAAHGESIVVLAVAGAKPRRTLGEKLEPGDDTLAFVLASGQSMSLAPARSDPGEAQTEVARGASMCLPCIEDGAVVGALELHGRGGAAPFTPEAVRAAALLAEVATAELLADRGGSAGAPPPGELSAELEELAARDSVRYEAIATALGALLAGG